MNYNPEMEGTPVIQILKQEDTEPLIRTFRLEDTFNLGHTFCWKPYQDDGRRKGRSCLCLEHINSFTGIGTYFCTPTDDQLRHPALWA
ncbi:hypothetical protein H671_8g19174 [Cricetulus griseus]|nr:hypothetical protein H671_8g19174 [Cricetulus griseus]